MGAVGEELRSDIPSTEVSQCDCWPHGPNEPCTCDGCWDCKGHVMGCTCDIAWDCEHIRVRTTGREETQMGKRRVFDRYGLTGYGLFLAMVLSLVGLVLLVCGVLTPLLIHSEHVTCLQLREVSGLDTKVVAKGMDRTCYVEIEPGVWIPSDKWRGIEE